MSRSGWRTAAFLSSAACPCRSLARAFRFCASDTRAASASFRAVTASFALIAACACSCLAFFFAAAQRERSANTSSSFSRARRASVVAFAASTRKTARSSWARRSMHQGCLLKALIKG